MKTHNTTRRIVPPQSAKWDLTGFPDQKYRCLVIDPPWSITKTGLRKDRPNQTTSLDYQTATKKDLIALPVADWAEPQSWLWLWATNGREKASGESVLKIAFELLEAWGFRYHTMITWDKKTGVCPYSPYQFVTEHILFAYRGKADFPKSSLGKQKTCFSAPSTIHSAKPDSFYQAIAANFPGPRLDVFARQNRAGFDAWGDQTGKLSVATPRPRRLLGGVGTNGASLPLAAAKQGVAGSPGILLI